MDLLLLVCLVSCAFAKTVHYDFNVSWVSSAPGGVTRPVMGINGEWPLPSIEADVNDTIVVNVKNLLGNQTTSLHFHGMYQRGSTIYDGGVGISQCPLQHEDSFTYTFKADPPGISWYHGHAEGQYPDGLRGMLIIHDPEWEECLNVDEQIYVSMSDWYHSENSYIVEKYLRSDNTEGDIPFPDCFLFNESHEAPSFDFEDGKRYLVRLVSYSSLACSNFDIEGHELTIVGADGVHTQPFTVDELQICPGQRYDIIVEANAGDKSDKTDFQWNARMDKTMLRHKAPPEEDISLHGKLRYGRKGRQWRRLMSRWRRHGFGGHRDERFEAGWRAKKHTKKLDDMDLKPLRNTSLLHPVDRHIDLRTNHTFYEGLGTRTGTGKQPWSEPKVPTLYTALSMGEDAFDESVYGPGVSPYILKSEEIVQVYMENPQEWPHPMHIHGHEFQVVSRGKGSWDGNESKLPEVPLMRDTVMIPAKGYILIRFRADNPGVWFFHCHIDLHLVGGMASTFIEAPDLLQKQQAIPEEAESLCKKAGKGSWGNCAGIEGLLSSKDADSNCNNVWSLGKRGTRS